MTESWTWGEDSPDYTPLETETQTFTGIGEYLDDLNDRYLELIRKLIDG